MKKALHTPAPWSKNEWPQKDSSICIGSIGTPLIAAVMLRDVSINEQKANADLIAAAPELLNFALYEDLYPITTEEREKEVESFCRNLGWGYGEPHTEFMRKYRIAALAKARGEA